MIVPVKPRLRGVSHLVAAVVAGLGGLLLVLMADSPRARFAAGVYGSTLAAMFAMSALYHIPTWDADTRRWLRRLDHSSIYLFMGGSYTPFCLLALSPESGARLLAMAWTAAAFGMLTSLLWVHKPRGLSAALYIGFGWMVLPYLSRLIAALGVSRVLLLFAGGLCFTVGGIIYALRKPDPLPQVFGYHEVFHALVIAGCALQFAVVATLICG